MAHARDARTPPPAPCSSPTPQQFSPVTLVALLLLVVSVRRTARGTARWRARRCCCSPRSPAICAVRRGVRRSPSLRSDEHGAARRDRRLPAANLFTWRTRGAARSLPPGRIQGRAAWSTITMVVNHDPDGGLPRRRPRPAHDHRPRPRLPLPRLRRPLRRRRRRRREFYRTCCTPGELISLTDVCEHRGVGAFGALACAERRRGSATVKSGGLTGFSAWYRRKASASARRAASRPMRSCSALPPTPPPSAPPRAACPARGRRPRRPQLGAGANRRRRHRLRDRLEAPRRVAQQVERLVALRRLVASERRVACHALPLPARLDDHMSRTLPTPRQSRPRLGDVGVRDERRRDDVARVGEGAGGREAGKSVSMDAGNPAQIENEKPSHVSHASCTTRYPQRWAIAPLATAIMMRRSA